MERTEGYGAGERPADLQLLKNCVNQATHDLEIGATSPTKKAPLIPLMLVGALELLVVDESAPLFARGYAFYKLLMWTACRTNDLSCLNPSSLSLTRFGLQGLLERTKTTGPGKRVRHLPIHVSASVGSWLLTGWKQACVCGLLNEKIFCRCLMRTGLELDGSWLTVRILLV